MGTIIAAATNMVLNLTFIPKYGYIAAAYTTLFSYIIYFLLHMYISKRLSGFYIIEIKYLLSVLLILIISYGIGLAFVNNLFVRLVTGGILVYIEIILLFKIYGKENVYNIIKRILGGRKYER